jgi:Ca2+-binding EF-hand superfamily protein
MRWLVLVLAALGDEKKAPAVTTQQREEFTRDFNDFDKNKDNFVDPQEVRHGFGGKLSEVELFEFYRDADVDLSGTVDLEEYVVYAATMA